MILIDKNPEPQEWTQYRMTPGAKYKSIPALVDALLIEQGYICAYCMRRIPTKDKINKNGEEEPIPEDHRIEHLKCRNRYPNLELDYHNMVICCPGHISDEDHCDRKKENDDIFFSPLEPRYVNTISYTSDGTIKSSNQVYDQELNTVLNLNTPLLKENRKSFLDGIITEINKQSKAGKQWTKAELYKILVKYRDMHKEDEKSVYYPYCGVAIFYITKKLNALNNKQH